MLDVMFYEVFKEEKAALQKYLPKKIKAGFREATVQFVPSQNPPAALISVRTQSVIPASWSNQLRGILTRSTGVDHLLQYRRKTKSKAACGYLGDYCGRAVGEQALLMTAALLRKLKIQTSHFNKFNRDCMTGLECQGRRLLVVGVGHIGKEVVDVAQGLRMEVRGVDIKKRLRNFKYVSLEGGLAWAEAVICALPLTEKTRGMLDYAAFKKAKSGVVFVNVSRGEVSPSRDMARLIDEGRLGGLGLDVFENEPELAESLRGRKKSSATSVKAILSLKDHPNVIFTPHNAFNTRESLERKARISAESVEIFLAKRKFPFPVR